MCTGAIQKYRKRFGSQGVVRGSVEGLEERLATVDRLLEQGTISKEEHAKQRTRLLDSL